jgi:hypothetical protein
MLGFMKEVTMGDHTDPSNMFRWERMRLNVPTTVSYDPTLPWVSKQRVDGTLSMDVFTCMDGMWPLAPSNRGCWQATSLISSMCNHIGTQHAARKKIGPSRTPGPWE